MQKEKISINDIELVQTCSAFPEQYDAYVKDEQVGYLRLRSGIFRVDYGDCGGDVVYKAHPKGQGDFTDNERAKYLKRAKMAIVKYHNFGIKSDHKKPININKILAFIIAGILIILTIYRIFI